MTLHEPAVAFTDLGLALEGALFAALLGRRAACEARLQRWFVVFFAALALAAFLGFVAHGFIVHKHSLAHRLVWSATLLAIGTIGLAAWAIGAQLLFAARTAERVTISVALVYGAYALLVLAGVQRYGFAIATYLPAAAFLLIAFGVRQRYSSCLRAGIVGLVLTFLAAGVQQLGLGLDPVWFNHNVLYHLIQAVALWLLFLAARGVTRVRAAA